MDFIGVISDSLQKKYTESRARDAEKLALSLEQGQFEVLSRVGHQLRGNAVTFGHEDLAELGRKMERAAEARSLSDGEDCLYALKAWVQERLGVGELG